MITRPPAVSEFDAPGAATVPVHVQSTAPHTVNLLQLGDRSDATPAPAARPAARRPRLVVVRGESPGAVFPILSGRNTLGRAGDKAVDIDLSPQEPAERVWTSRQHACVTSDGAGLLVEDLVSLNGTFVNRDRVHPGHPRPLHPGDVVQVGEVQLRVELE